jgi:hypothetical protein
MRRGKVSLKCLALAACGLFVACGGRSAEPVAEAQKDPKRQICERLDECVPRRATITVDECLAALAGDSDEVIASCAACLRTIEDRCPPDDACEDRCPPHGF